MKDLPNLDLLRNVRFPDLPNPGPSLPSPQEQQSFNPAYLLGALFSIAIFFLLVYKFIYRRNNFNKQLAAHDLPANDAKSYDNKPNSNDLSLPEHEEPLLSHQLRPQLIECIKKGEFCSVGVLVQSNYFNRTISYSQNALLAILLSFSGLFRCTRASSTMHPTKMVL